MTEKTSIDRLSGQPAVSASPSALLALAGIGLMAGASPAMAQEEPRLGGVIVTDTAIDDSYTRAETESAKATAPLLDTPQTVSVIPQELIRDRAARTLSEVLRNTPGISFNAERERFRHLDQQLHPARFRHQRQRVRRQRPRFGQLRPRRLQHRIGRGGEGRGCRQRPRQRRRLCQHQHQEADARRLRVG
nr:TonB-dependent receptor plug domain-containing protein [Sphingopyxis sp. PET50]